MSLIAPLSLILGLLAVPIVLLYMLRLRRRQVPISSTMLWRRLMRDREANAPWQRLRRNLLLILQLIILALLVIALARPYVPAPSVATGNVVVLLDGSASMLAREANEVRFDLARREVERMIDDLSGDSQMTLILAGATPRVLVSSGQDPATLRASLAQASASPVSADWSGALALAAGAVQGIQDGRIVLVSDGGLPDSLPPMPVDVVFLPIGSAEENLAISALSARDGADGPQLFASVTNYGRLEQRALFNLSLDGELFDARRIEVPAGEARDLIWALPEEASTIGASLTEITQDNLALDDRAWAVREGGQDGRVLLLSDGNRFLETALSVLPGLDVFKVDPAAGLATVESHRSDVIVLDSVPLPAELPDANLMIVNPLKPALGQEGGSAPLLDVAGSFTGTEIVRLEDSPLQRFVDWSGVNVRAAQNVVAPWARPLVVADDGPLLLAGEWEGRRVVILTFDLQDSDLPLQIAFPILMANIMSWLDPGRSLLGATDFGPGDPVRIAADSSAETVVVQLPDGSSWANAAAEGTLVFPETDQLGVYEVMMSGPDGERLADSFAVNLRSAGESHIAPAASVQIGLHSLDTSGEKDLGQSELWPWLALLALLILMAEWWVYQRGPRLPGRDDWVDLTRRRTF
jgi:Ca-activated chloride channel family protein